MEGGGALRFTSAEGGARLARAARARNTLAALSGEHAAFVAGKLLQEQAYSVRGPLSAGRQRSVYVARASRVPCVAHQLNILTELSVAAAAESAADIDLETNEVLVVTSAVFHQLLKEGRLHMLQVNVLIIDSCHTIHTDPHLQAIMAIHSEQATPDQPRILALTYPLFSQKNNEKNLNDTSEQNSTYSCDNLAAVEPAKLLSNDDDSDGIAEHDTSQHSECNVIEEISNEEDILRIDDIIRENDTTKLIIVKDNAILSNKAKIIELEDVPDEELSSDQKFNYKAATQDIVTLNDTVYEINYDTVSYKASTKAIDTLNDNIEEINQETISDRAASNTIEALNDKIGGTNEETFDNKAKYNNIDEKIQTKLKSIQDIESMSQLIKTSQSSCEESEFSIDEAKEIGKFQENTDNEYSSKNINEHRVEDIIKIWENVNVERSEKNDTKEKAKEQTNFDASQDDLKEEDEDFLLYEKLEWKISELETKLCCTADLAEDIDGIKRLSAGVSAPRELLVQHASRAADAALPATYAEVEAFMRETVGHFMRFIDEHRYDPTEIYGDDAFCEELKNIPDPTLDPKEIFQQFLYVLDELGPYGADKAAYVLLGKIEKLKVKIPYERHFLLLCVCTTVLVKIRCVAENVFQQYDSDWVKIHKFCTPKIHRLAEILRHFSPPNLNAARTDVTSVAKGLDAAKMLNDLERCDFASLSDRLADKVNTYEANLCEIHDIPPPEHKRGAEKPTAGDLEPEKIKDEPLNADLKCVPGPMPGPQKRMGPRNKGRGKGPRHNHAARALQMQLNPDALCGIVFMKEPLMARILFLIIAELSRSHPELGFLCAQYSGEETAADPVKEPRELERQRRKQEEVLKKFRMHECNLLLATSALEEGIDLPRCNLVLRWDAPASYRSYGLCRSRARAPRSACVLLAQAARRRCGPLVHRVATYRELDQMLSRKCGCGIQDEPPATEEEHANLFTRIIKPYTPDDTRRDQPVHSGTNELRDHCGKHDLGEMTKLRDELDDLKIESEKLVNSSEIVNAETGEKSERTRDNTEAIEVSETVCENAGGDRIVSENKDVSEGRPVSESELASVDLSSAISLINRYCGKLPSDTFTRLAPQWWMEEVYLPVRPTGCSTVANGTDLSTGCPTGPRDGKEESRKAYICTLRLPLNCPVKYNIVGHPMPTRVLARRVVALQACRILHRSAELDNHLMPIGKENFKAPELEYAPAPPGDAGVCGAPRPASAEPDPARPGTTKRRQYYFKRTAWSFTDCQPVQDTSDSEIDPPAAKLLKGASMESQLDPEDTNTKEDGGATQNGTNDTSKAGGKRNMLYAIVSRLWCALPERYNTRGRRLHVPQTARQGLGVLTSRDIKKIPAFPVYTRSGEVRVSVERVEGADVRVSPRRARLVRRFMRFVFAEVLRVRRRGMRLATDARHNNYYVVPTCRTILDDNSERIDIDWDFLELIYQHTEKKNSEIERSSRWNQEDETEGLKQKQNENENSLQNREHNNVLNNLQNGTLDKDKNGANNKTINKGQNGFQNGTLKQEQNNGHNDIDNEIYKINLETDIKNKESKPETDLKNRDDLEISEPDLKKDQVNEDVGEGKEAKKELQNPLLRPGEKFLFDAEKYKEAVVTPWYRNQDQPQFFLVAEICWKLSPESAFPSVAHTTFRHYYTRKYGVRLTQAEQPLLDVDHTSARLNLLTPRYVNRKGVALPVSSERTRRAKRDRLDQKQILVPELCRVHPFAAPLWFATVALPCVLYRINALLIADEIRRSVAIDVGLGAADVGESARPGFQWPPLDFGWSLAEVLSVDAERAEREGRREEARGVAVAAEQAVEDGGEGGGEAGPERERTLNEILQEKEDAESGFEIGTWSNDMACSLPDDYDELLEPLPPNLTFCTSASGGSNWPDFERTEAFRAPRAPRAFSMADSDCSFMSSDMDTDDSSLESDGSEDDTTLGSHQHATGRLGVRIEYKTPHEAEAFELPPERRGAPAPQPDARDDARDRALADALLRGGPAPPQHIMRFQQSVEDHKKEILEKGLLIMENEPVLHVLPPGLKTALPEANMTVVKDPKPEAVGTHNCQANSITDKIESRTVIEEEDIANVNHSTSEMCSQLSRLDLDYSISEKSPTELFKDLFPYGGVDEAEFMVNGQVSIEAIERSKRVLLQRLKDSLTEEEVAEKSCFSMVDVNIDSPDYVNEKVANVGFDNMEAYIEKLNRVPTESEKRDTHDEVLEENSSSKAEFDFDYQPKLEGHPGPSPSVILQALTMSNANDGINLERLETIGDSFLKFAITAYLYCAQPTVHEGKLSHMRSKQVSNLNLYRLGRGRRLGARMIASKFEPHDNWLPPCHRAPPTVPGPRGHNAMQDAAYWEEGSAETAAGVRRACDEGGGCFIPYNLITQHSIPDKSVADCVEALIGAYLIECGPRGALLFMSWLGIKVLPRYEIPLEDRPELAAMETDSSQQRSARSKPAESERRSSESECSSGDEAEGGGGEQDSDSCEDSEEPRDWSWPGRGVGTLRPYRDRLGRWVQPVFGELRAPPSPLLRYIQDPDGELEQMLSGYDALEQTLRYRFRDRSLLLQALTHASHQLNRLTDCYQRLEFLGDAILDYLITRHLYEDARRHSPGALTDLRSALVNNTIFATLAVRHGFHKYFRHMSPGLNEVLTRYVRIQEENGHSISEEHYLIQEDEMEQAEDVEVPKALGDLFESVAGAIFLDSGMSLGAVWRSYVGLMGAELEAFSAAAPKSPVRELLEAEPDTAKFGKPERLADGRRVRVCVEVFGRGTFKGVGRNYRIAKGTAARCALRHLKRAHRLN